MQQLISRRTATGWAIVNLMAPGVGHAAFETQSKASTALPFLRGVNFTGLTHERGSLEPSLNAYNYFLSQKKMNVVRLNFTWEWIQPYLRGNLDENSCHIIDRQIINASNRNSYIILELHNYGRRIENGTSHIIGESQFVGVAEFNDVWFKIAARWGNNPKVILALMNEPHDQDSQTLVFTSNSAIAAIRRAGSENLIMVSGNNWNSMGWSKGSDNQKYMLQIKDEKQNFCFDVHHYFDDWSQGQSPNVRDDPIKSMLEFTAWAAENKKRAFCGEFACSYNKKGLDAARQLLKHIEENKNVFIGWAWWGAGGPWQPDYPFLLDPFASMYSATNPDPNGSATWLSPVDRPQMKVLQEFLPPDATPFNAWLIEDQSDLKTSILYRRGDFSRQKTSDLKSIGKWEDSGPHRFVAFANANPPLQESDGGVYFSPSTECLETPFMRDRNQESIFSIVSTAKIETGKQKSILSSVESGGSVGPRFAISASGALTTGVKTLPKQSCPLSERISTSTKTFVQSTRQLSRQVGDYADVELSFSAKSDLKVSTISRPTESWARNSVNIIGAKDRSKTDMFDGVIYELAVFNTYLAPDIVAKIQGRMHWDCGLAHKLPSNHPYRLRPPAKI